MRLRNAAAAAVLSAAAAISIPPAVAAVHPAATRTVAVTIVTIDRAGKRVPAQVQLQNLATGTVYNLTGGKASQVPGGTYNVGAQIQTPGNPPSQTLADRQLTVTRPGTATLDARRGRLVRFTVNDPKATASDVFLVAYSPATGYEYTGFGEAATYVIPAKLPSGWNFAAMADLSSATASGSPVVYGLIRTFTGEIPASPTWFSSASKLTTLHAAVRRLNPGDTAVVDLTPQVSGPDDLYSPLWPASTLYEGQAPYTVQFRLTPGYAWQQSGPYGEELLNNVPVWGAHQYDETFGAAAFSPSWAAEQAVEVVGHTLFAGTFNGQWMLTDPAFSGFSDASDGLGDSESTALYQGSKLIAGNPDGDVTRAIPAVTKWYREQVVARPDSGQMPGQVTLDYTFPAAAQPNDGSYSPDYIVPTIRPLALNGDNAAKPGTKTTVPITLTYSAADHSGVRGVQVWASGNGGKGWAALKVSHRGGTWTVTVANPERAGYVSLRVRAALGNGVTTEVTVINAYAIS